MKLNLEGTVVFQKNWTALENKQRVIVNEGGSGSSKTYSLAQVFLLLLLKSDGVVLTVVRKTMPSLRATAMRDFFGLLKQNNLYNQNKHDKTNNTYTFGKNFIEFLSVDDPIRVRSRRRDHLWINEANELDLEDWRQLSMRTSGCIFLDYNPSHQYHWIYDEVLPREDALLIKSTFEDNPFLKQEVVDEIKRYKERDENYWQVYGLGERGKADSLIYKNWDYCDAMPDGDAIYGLDFGYNYPSSLIKVILRDSGWYAEELLYEPKLTNSQLIEKLGQLGIPKQKEIYCDREPQRIAEIQNAGYWAMSADKDVKKGIDTVKSRRLYVTKGSVNLVNELKKYSYKQKQDASSEDPVKINDHACFTKDTKIELLYGDILFQKSSGIKNVYEFMGAKVTEDHPYLTQRGFVTLDGLRYSDRIVIWKNKLLMELSLGDTQNQKGVSFACILYLLQRSVLAGRLNAFTGIYGKNIMEIFLKVIIFIIKTVIHLIILWIISNLFHQKNMLKNTLKLWERTLKLLVPLQLNGKNQRRERSFISQRIEKSFTREYLCCLGKLRNIIQEFVINVRRNIKPHSQQGQNSATIIAKLRHCGKEEVFATTTSSGFFIANGTLVSNCDALRYAIHSHYKEFGIQEQPATVRPFTSDEMRKLEIADAIKRAISSPDSRLLEDYSGY